MGGAQRNYFNGLLKPTILWYATGCGHEPNPHRGEAHSVYTVQRRRGNDLAYYTYSAPLLSCGTLDGINRPELEGDRNEHKHYQMAKRMIERVRRDVLLWNAECQGYGNPA